MPKKKEPAAEKRYYPDKNYKKFTARKKPKGVSRFRADRYPEVQAEVRGERAKERTSKDPRNVIRRARRGMNALEDYQEHVLKPIEEWDFDELERGRPRGPKGGFSGPAPRFMTHKMHEQMMDRYKSLVRQEMSKKMPSVLNVINHILNNNDTDDDGKPLVPASTKLDAAKFLIEHLLGKPKQETKQDISVILQGVMAHALVQPGPDGVTPRIVRGVGQLASAAIDEEDDDVDN